MITEPPENTDPTTPAVAPPAANTITPEVQAVIDERVKAAKDAAWAEARRTFEGRPRPNGGGQRPEPAPSGAAATTQPTDVSAQIARHTAFTRAVGKFDLTDDAFEIVADEFARANVDDVSTWVSKRAAAFGWKPIATSTPTATTAAPNGAPASGPSAATPTPPPMPGSAPPARVVDDTVRIIDMSRGDVDALSARLGPHKFAQRLKAELRADTRRIPLRR